MEHIQFFKITSVSQTTNSNGGQDGRKGGRKDNPGKDEPRMTSVEIAQVTGKRHKVVLATVREMEPAWEKTTGRQFTMSEYRDSMSRLQPCYTLTKDECLFVATKFNKESRTRIILCWEELERLYRLQAERKRREAMRDQKQAERKRQEAERKRREAEQAERKRQEAEQAERKRQEAERKRREAEQAERKRWQAERDRQKAEQAERDLQAERKRQLAINLALQLQKDTIDMQHQQIMQLAPKADYCDEVLASGDCYTMTQVAKELSMTVFDLTKWLIAHGIIYFESGLYMLYGDLARKDYARSRTHIFYDQERMKHTKTYLVWTERGRCFIHRFMKNVGQQEAKKGRQQIGLTDEEIIDRV